MPKPPVISALRYVREYEAATGTPKQRVLQVAKKLGRTRAQVRAALHDEWSGDKYRATFKGTYTRFDWSREEVIAAVIKSDGNRTQAAKRLNCSTQTLYEKLRTFGLQVTVVLLDVKRGRTLWKRSR